MSLKIELVNICKSYNGKPVFRGASLSFDDGGVHLLMGPNGSGKSTFLRICALLEDPDEGTVNYYSGGERLRRDISLKRRITIVLPGVGLFNTTVFRNAAYGLAVRGLKRRAIEEKADSALEFVGLLHKRDQNALTLSSGEAQRLGIARALVIEPEILFLDEPTASTDLENTGIIESIITSMKNESGSTVIATTHDMAQAERLGGRELFIESGKILQKDGREVLVE